MFLNSYRAKPFLEKDGRVIILGYKKPSNNNGAIVKRCTLKLIGSTCLIGIEASEDIVMIKLGVGLADPLHGVWLILNLGRYLQSNDRTRMDYLLTYHLFLGHLPSSDIITSITIIIKNNPLHKCPIFNFNAGILNS